METTLLTKENAHRVTMVRRVDAPESEPVAFLFRGKRHGYCSYSHLVGNPGKEEILAPADFKDWEVVEVAHPGYLEEYFKQARVLHHRLAAGAVVLLYGDCAPDVLLGDAEFLFDA